MRFMGKRQIGTLQPSELAVTILVSNIASMPIENIETPLLLGAIPILILLFFEYLISMISLKSRKFRKILSGKPIFVIENGKINQKALSVLRFTIDDLTESLRGCGVFNLSDVAYAIVETNGKMNVIKNFEASNLTAKMVQLNGQEVTIPLVIISDGVFIYSNINYLNIEQAYVLKYLENKNLDPKNIFIMTADKNKNFVIVKKENKK